MTRVDSKVLSRALERKPHYLSATGFISQLIEQALDSAFTLGKASPASGGPSLKGGEAFTSNKSLTTTYVVESAKKEKKAPEPAWEKNVPAHLFEHEDAIREFWRFKKGSKAERAWTFLIHQLEAIQAKHGASVLKEQLDLAINGRWTSITLANYERFKPKASKDPADFDWNSITGVSI